LLQVRELIQEYAPPGKENIPIVSSEWGYSLVDWWGNATPIDEQTQARFLVRMYLSNLSRGIPVSIWYDWSNDGNDPNEREHNFGMVRSNLEPKPAYTACKALATTLDGYTIVGRMDAGDAEDFVLILSRRTENALALWTMGESHSISLPMEPQTGNVDVTGMLGNTSNLSWTGGSLETDLTQSPKYILLNDAALVIPAPGKPNSSYRKYGFKLPGQRSIYIAVPPDLQKARVINSLGKLVRDIPVTSRTIAWDGKDNTGSGAGPGVYILELLGGKNSKRIRFALTP
jgi:hypothetical protein